jgi:hypothetical protein
MYRADWGEQMEMDVSVRKSSEAAQRAADALLRSLGGSSVKLRLPIKPCTSDMDQLSLSIGAYQDLAMSPAVFRRVRATLAEGEEGAWELLLSASSVMKQVSAMQLQSAETLFEQALAVLVGERSFVLRAVSSSETFGQVYLYRLLLRESLPKAM